MTILPIRPLVNSEPSFVSLTMIGKGKIRWFDARRGYGFIIPADGGPDIFVHRRILQVSARLRRLEPGQLVEYEAQQTTQGIKATKVTVLVTVS